MCTTQAGSGNAVRGCSAVLKTVPGKQWTLNPWLWMDVAAGNLEGRGSARTSLYHTSFQANLWFPGVGCNPGLVAQCSDRHQGTLSRSTEASGETEVATLWVL